VPPEQLIAQFQATVAKKPIYIETDPALSLESVQDLVLALADGFADKPLLLLVDSLQALPMGDFEQRAGLEFWLNGLDQLKLVLNGRLTIIAVSEKNRSSYEEARISGGKGSGNIEYKGEQLLDMRQGSDENTFILEVLKNRDYTCGVPIYLAKVFERGVSNGFLFKLEETYADAY